MQWHPLDGQCLGMGKGHCPGKSVCRAAVAAARAEAAETADRESDERGGRDRVQERAPRDSERMRHESDRAERTRDAMRFMKRNLRLVGAVPFGYDCVEGRKLVPNAAEQETVREALRLAPDLRFFGMGGRQMRAAGVDTLVDASDMAVVGLGAGQTSRLGAVEVALHRAGGRAKLSCMASDAYFPHADGIQLAAERGVTAIIQPGGSVRDEEVIKAADEHDIAMIMTGVRQFRH